VHYIMTLFHSDDFTGSQVFPSFVTCERVVTKQSVLARLKEKRAQKQAQDEGV
jgi:hypothetical protein